MSLHKKETKDNTIQKIFFKNLNFFEKTEIKLKKIKIVKDFLKD